MHLKEYDYVHHQKRGKNSWLKNLFQVIEEMDDAGTGQG